MMPDREKVMKGLAYCGKGCGYDCPYWNDFAELNCVKLMRADALALLKEQEPAEPHTYYHGIDVPFTYCCGYCDLTISEGDNYCPHCGKAVKWDDD